MTDQLTSEVTAAAWINLAAELEAMRAGDVRTRYEALDEAAAALRAAAADYEEATALHAAQAKEIAALRRERDALAARLADAERALDGEAIIAAARYVRLDVDQATRLLGVLGMLQHAALAAPAARAPAGPRAPLYGITPDLAHDPAAEGDQ